MAFFMVEIPHTIEECILRIEQMAVNSSDLLEKTEWGCLSGEHTSWTLMEAESEAIARTVLPEDMRDTARIHEVNRLTLDYMRSRHSAISP